MARVKEIFAEILELLLWLVGVLTLLQILFGNGFVEFFGIDPLGATQIDFSCVGHGRPIQLYFCRNFSYKVYAS